jgi:putative tryptophan/tyrosine transport system substrate-binding protein
LQTSDVQCDGAYTGREIEYPVIAQSGGDPMQFDQLKRRDFIALLGGAAASSPFGVRAQQRLPRIGFLGLVSEPIAEERLRAGLRALGYIEGTNIVVEWRRAHSVEELPALAAELVRMPVDVIFAPSSTYVEAARQATTTVPIVFAVHADPVGLGHVGSLARPGGNVTGTSMLLTELAAKGLETFSEALPRARRIGVLWNPTTPSHPRALQAVEAAGEKLGLELRKVPARSLEELDGAFGTMAQERVDGFLAVASPLVVGQGEPLAALELKYRLPGMFPFKENVVAGGLMSYGANPSDLYHRASVYVDKILKGAKPADLPVEQASKYELVINLKTAKALSLDLPPGLLARADDIIE